VFWLLLGLGAGEGPITPPGHFRTQVEGVVGAENQGEERQKL